MSTRTFTVNNKLYKAKEFDFNFLCDLEDQGLSLEDIERKPMSLIRTYVAFCGNLSKEQAGKEVEAHVMDGNDFSTIVEIMSKEMEDSGFFRAKQTNENQGSTKRTRTKKAESEEVTS